MIRVHLDNAWEGDLTGRVIHTYPDGSQLFEGRITLSEVLPSIRIKIVIVVPGIYFEDGSQERIFTAADFDENGVLIYTDSSARATLRSEIVTTTSSSTTTTPSTKKKMKYQGTTTMKILKTLLSITTLALTAFSLNAQTTTTTTSPNENVITDTKIECPPPCGKATGTPSESQNTQAGASAPSLSENNGIRMSISFGNLSAENIPNGPLSIEPGSLEPYYLLTPQGLKYPTYTDREMMYVNRDYDPSNPNHDWGGYPTTILCFGKGSPHSYEYERSSVVGEWRLKGEHTQERPILRTYTNSSQTISTFHNFNYIVEYLDDGTKIHYQKPLGSGTDISFSSLTHAIYNTADDVVEVGAFKNEVLYRGIGNYRQIYNQVDGLLDIVESNIPNPTGYRIDWYPLSQVTGKTNLYQFTGTPIKSWVISSPSANPLQIKLEEIRHGTPYLRFVNLWTYYQTQNLWELTKGEGAEAITESIQTTVISGGKTVLNTMKDAAGNIASKIKKVYENINGFDKLIQSIQDPGGLNYTTAYEYNNDGLVKKITFPNGLTKSYAYGSGNKVASVTTPTVYGNKTEEYVYSDNGELATKIEKISGQTFKTTSYQISYDNEGGKTETTIETVDGISRTTRLIYHPYSNVDTVAKGQLKQFVNYDGTEYHYEYSTLPNGRKTIITLRANGVDVPHKSTREIHFYTNGDLTRKEQFVHTGSDYDLVSWENYTYNSAHQIIRTDYSTGRFSTTKWICKGPIETVDEFGIRTEYFYDTTKRLVQTKRHSPWGTQITSLVLEPNDKILSMTKAVNGSSRTSYNEYDSIGRIRKEVDESGLVTLYSYSNFGNTVTKVLPGGGTEIKTSHPRGQLLSTTGTGTLPRYFAYTFSNNNFKTRTSISPDFTLRWNSSYSNGFGDVVLIEEPTSANRIIRTVLSYDSKGRNTGRTTAGQPSYEYEYDVFGNLSLTKTISSTNDSDIRVFTEIQQYIKENGIVWRRNTSTEPRSGSTIPAGKVLQNQLSGLSPSLASKTIFIDQFGKSHISYTTYNSESYTLCEYETDDEHPNSTATNVYVDGLKTSTTNFIGNTTSLTYNEFGQITSIKENANRSANYIYNKKGQLWKTVNTKGGVNEYSYDPTSGKIIAIKDSLGKRSRYTYNLRGQLEAQHEDDIPSLRIAYNMYGKVYSYSTYQKWGTNRHPELYENSTLFFYDPLTWQLVTKSDPENSNTTYNYDDFGRLTSIVGGRRINYSYNGFNQVSSIGYSDGTRVDIQYDHAGQISQVDDARGSTYYYYQDGLMVGENYRSYSSQNSDPAGYLIHRNYDSFGRQINYTVDNVMNSNYSYNDEGRISSVDIGKTSPFTYTYFSHLTNSVSSINYPNGLLKTMTYENERDLLSTITYQKANSSILGNEYTYDLQGRRSTEERIYNQQSSTFEYQYNNMSELIRTVKNNNVLDSYLYDYAGNRLQSFENGLEITYVPNRLDLYEDVFVEGTKVASGYDYNRNQTSLFTSTGTWNISYDDENRPVTFTQGNKRIEISYDYLSRRAAKKVFENDMLQSHRKFLYHDYFMVAELDGMSNDTMIKTYIWDPVETMRTRPLSYNDLRNDQTYYYLHDAQKNVIGITNETGVLIEKYKYSPFGQIVDSLGSLDNNYCFSSEYYDPELGLVYYNFRYYNPLQGRWITRDPIGESGGYNLYRFANNAPTDYVDYLGNSPVSLDNNQFRNTAFFQIPTIFQAPFTSQEPLPQKPDRRNCYPMGLTGAPGPWIPPQPQNVPWPKNPGNQAPAVNDPNDPCCTIVTVMIGLEISHVGHVGIAVGDEFVDFGPVDPAAGTSSLIIGCQGGKFICATKPKRDDARIAFRARYDRNYKYEINVCKENADKILNYYKSIEYHWFHILGVSPFGEQCTTAAGNALNEGGILFPNRIGMSPNDMHAILMMNKDIKHQCGPNKDKVPEVSPL